MNTYSDRAAALKAALRDLARDLEADLGKQARSRGTTTPGANGYQFRHPGDDLASFERQKAEVSYDGPARVLNAYRAAISQAREAIPQDAKTSDELDLRTELIELVDDISQVANHGDAELLVATFN